MLKVLYLSVGFLMLLVPCSKLIEIILKYKGKSTAVSKMFLINLGLMFWILAALLLVEKGS